MNSVVKSEPNRSSANDAKRVLIVEDEPMVSVYVNELLSGLKGSGFSCAVAGTLQEGLSYLNKTAFDVVLLDLGLPDSSGIETAAAMRSAFPRVPIIVLTGLAEEEAAMNALRTDVQEYLVKGQIAEKVLIRSIRYAIERKRITDALRKSEERLRMVIEATRTLIYEVDLVTGRILILRGLNEVFGYEPREISFTREWWEGLLHPDDRKRVQSHIRNTVKSGRDYSVEYRIRHKLGHWITVQDTGKAVRDAEGRVTGFVGGVVDITERKQTEDMLRYHASLLENVSDAIVSTNKDFVIKSWNKAAERIYGWTEEEARGKHIDALLRTKFIEMTREQSLSRLFKDGSVQVEVVHWNKEQKSIHVRSSVTLLRDGSRTVTGTLGVLHDITESRKAEQALIESEERFRTLADNIPQLAWMAHPDGWIFWYNKRWFDYTEAKQEYMRGYGWQELVHPDHEERIAKSFREAVAGGTVWEETLPFRGRNGRYRWFLCRAIPIRNEGGTVQRWFGTYTDITDRIRMEEEIRQMAHHDLLTGLPNRRLFSEIISVELAQAKRKGGKAAVLFLDLDRFKEINDTLGHDTGDELLREAAERLRKSVRTSDTVARIGGDEFNIIISDITYPEYASEVAKKLLSEIRKPFSVKGYELRVSVSIGISVFPHDSDEIETLLRYADIAMYHAKEKGRNNFQFYNPAINTRSLERIKFENSLRRAIERGEFILHFQPLVDIRTRRIVSAEALLRWRHPERGLLEPRDFMGAAEEVGFAPDIDEWALKAAGGQIRRWMNEGVRPVSLTVNLSSREFQKPDLPERISTVLKETAIPPEHLNIEIGETTAMEHIERTRTHLRRLAAMGVRTTIDNFGTGFSSVGCLKRLPIAKLKIDRSFVHDLISDSEDQVIVTTMLLMAHTMKLKVAATGVEAEDQLSFLRGKDCDEAQGYFFSGPVSPEDLQNLVNKELA